MNMNLPFSNVNFEVAISSVLAIKRITHRKQRGYNQARHSNLAIDWSKHYDLKRECQHECRTAFNRYVPNLVDPNKNIIANLIYENNQLAR